VADILSRREVLTRARDQALVALEHLYAESLDVLAHANRGTLLDEEINLGLQWDYLMLLEAGQRREQKMRHLWARLQSAQQTIEELRARIRELES
jgi:hypothetical protein